jgi:hypothetical protein
MLLGCGRATYTRRPFSNKCRNLHMRSLWFAALILGFVQSAMAQSQPLKSFSYMSQRCTDVDGAPLLTFSKDGKWRMGLGADMAPPGAGIFPTGNFNLRRVGLTVMGGSVDDWALIGHSGPNGDWVSLAVPSGKSEWMDFPSDASPLFSAGEYFDAHVSNCNGTHVLVSFWYVPVPLPMTATKQLGDDGAARPN